MPTQGLRRATFIAGSLVLLSGCAGVPPVPAGAATPPQQAGQTSPQSANPSGVVQASATEPAALPQVYPPVCPQPVNPPPPTPPTVAVAVPVAVAPNADPAKAEEKKGFDVSDLAPDNMWKNVKKATGYGPDEKIARASFQEGEALFREKKYTDAIPKFKTAMERWPDSTLEEDAQFLLGECYFFSDKYPKADDTYGELLKKHDNSRYLDTVMKREFALGKYWEQKYFTDPHWPVTPNLTDKERPMFDTFGNAINAYQRVRTYDPTGPLADSSVMATANAYFVKGEFENAAYNYDLLRKEYPTSKFQPQAHVLGLQAKLRVYQGKDYDGVPLHDAEEIAHQALTQFGTQLGPEQERVSQTSKAIVEMKAERDWAMAQYYEKKRHYGSARFYYVGLIKEYPLTQHAQMAQARLEQIRDLPEVPPNHLKWLTDLFPDL